MEELTFAQLDALERERQDKVRDVTERLTRALAREFSASELALIWSYSIPPSSILVQALRTHATRRGGETNGITRK